MIKITSSLCAVMTIMPILDAWCTMNVALGFWWMVIINFPLESVRNWPTSGFGSSTAEQSASASVKNIISFVWLVYIHICSYIIKITEIVQWLLFLIAVYARSVSTKHIGRYSSKGNTCCLSSQFGIRISLFRFPKKVIYATI